MTSNNRLLRASVGAMLTASLFMPSLASAQSVRADVSVRVAFCSAVAEHGTNLDEHLAALRLQLQAKRDERTDILEQKRADRRERIDAKKAEMDAKRTERVANLRAEIATTAEQRAAIATFQAAVQTAVRNRQAAVDSANATFRAGLEKALTDRKAKSDTAIATMTASIKAAIAKAKADCAAGVDPATIRANFAASVKAAREKFMADRQAIDRTGETVKALVDTRNAAAAKARIDFQAAMEKARVDLKAAFGVKMENDENES